MSTVNKRARGEETSLNYALETTINSVPTSGTKKTIRKASETFNSSIPNEFDSDISNNGMKSGTVRGTTGNDGGFSAQLSNQSHDDWVKSLFGRSSYTTDNYDDTVDLAVSNGVGTLTFSGSVSISGVIVNGPIKLAGFSNSANNTIWRVSSVDSGAGTIVLGAVHGDQSAPVAESSVSATINQGPYVKNGGSEKVTFTVEKSFQAINKEKGVDHLTGRLASTVSFQNAPGGGVEVTVDTIGQSYAQADDQMLSPRDWDVRYDWSAGATQINASGGSGTIAAGDELYIEGDTTNKKYEVVSIGGSNGVFSITPALGAAISEGDNIFFGTPGTEQGEAQKMENNLGYVVVDGSSFCVSGSTIDMTNSAEPTFCVGDADADSVDPGERNVTGTLNAYKSSNAQAILNKVYAGTTFPIANYYRDRDGNVTAIVIPSADGEYTLAQVGSAGVVPQEIPFKALEDSTLETNAIFFSMSA